MVLLSHTAENQEASVADAEVRITDESIQAQLRHQPCVNFHEHQRRQPLIAHRRPQIIVNEFQLTVAPLVFARCYRDG